jgi:hypothetical protein
MYTIEQEVHGYSNGFKIIECTKISNTPPTIFSVLDEKEHQDLFATSPLLLPEQVPIIIIRVRRTVPSSSFDTPWK